MNPALALTTWYYPYLRRLLLVVKVGSGCCCELKIVQVEFYGLENLLDKGSALFDLAVLSAEICMSLCYGEKSCSEIFFVFDESLLLGLVRIISPLVERELSIHITLCLAHLRELEGSQAYFVESIHVKQNSLVVGHVHGRFKHSPLLIAEAFEDGPCSAFEMFQLRLEVELRHS